MDSKTEQTKCKTCNAPILESTAAKFDGSCRRCQNESDSSTGWLGILIVIAVLGFGVRSCNGVFSGKQSADENFVQLIVGEIDKLQKSPPRTAKSGVDKFNRFAASVTRFDKSSLRPELANWAGRYEQALYSTRDVLQKMERQQSSGNVGNAMIDSFLRGANGDPLGRMHEEEARNNALQNDYQYCLNALSRLASELQGMRDRFDL